MTKNTKSRKLIRKMLTKQHGQQQQANQTATSKPGEGWGRVSSQRRMLSRSKCPVSTEYEMSKTRKKYEPHPGKKKSIVMVPDEAQTVDVRNRDLKSAILNKLKQR